MNRINFNGKDGGGFHHLTPYQKKSRKRNIFPIDKLKVQKAKVEQNLWEERLRWFAVNPNILFEKPIEEIKEIKEIKEMSDKIEIINDPKGYSYNKGFYNWHAHRTLKKGVQELTVTDSAGGCGMQQFYNWRTIKDKETAIELISKYLETRDSGIGLVLCQVGQQYFNGVFVQALNHHGFKIIDEYINWRHGSYGKYKQRIYSLHLTYKNDR